MKLTVIGFWGGFPAKNEATSGYLLETEGFSLLIDCGSGVLSKLQNYKKLEDLDAVWLSHYHHDHVADIGPLYFARLVKGQLGQVTQVMPIYGHTLDKVAFDELTNQNVTKGIAYQEDTPLQIGPFQMTFLRTHHSVPCFATRLNFKGKTLVYTADTSLFPELIAFSKNADLLIAECSLYDAQDGRAYGHLTSKDVADLAKAANAKRVLLTHLPHYGNHGDLIKRVQHDFNEKVQLAKTGWTWEV